MKIIDRLALLLLIIGGIHLLLIGIFNLNMFEIAFGSHHETPVRVIYTLIGISALWCMKYFTFTPKGGSRLRGR